MLKKEQNENKKLLNNIAKQKQLLIQEMKLLKEKWEGKIEKEHTDYHNRINDIKTQMLECENNQRVTKEKAVKLIQSYEQIEQKFRKLYEPILAKLEAENKTLKEQFNPVK